VFYSRLIRNRWTATKVSRVARSLATFTAVFFSWHHEGRAILVTKEHTAAEGTVDIPRSAKNRSLPHPPCPSCSSRTVQQRILNHVIPGGLQTKQPSAKNVISPLLTNKEHAHTHE
jgi:hypothetical protein